MTPELSAESASALVRRVPRRRRVWVVALVLAPVLVAGSAWASVEASAADAATFAAAGRPFEAAAEREESPPIVAQPVEAADQESLTPRVTAVPAGAAEPVAASEPVPRASGGGDRGSGTDADEPGEPTKPRPGSPSKDDEPADDGGSSESQSVAPATVNYKDFCRNATATASASSESSMLSAINKERARNGAAPLSGSGSLSSAAQGYAGTMADRNEEHDELGFGSDAWMKDVFKHAPDGGYENIYASSTGGAPWATAHSALMKSSSHCSNIMNPDLRTFGAGAVQSADGSWYLVQRFGR